MHEEKKTGYTERMLTFISWAFSQLSPKVAAFAVAYLAGRADLADDLIAICHRESRCRNQGAHEIDAHISGREYRGQVRLGHLRPWCQRPAQGGWATRGAWGLSAGAHWRWMPPCYQPDWFDSPVVSAVVALRKYEARCVKRRQTKGWCRVPREVWRNNIRAGRA